MSGQVLCTSQKKEFWCQVFMIILKQRGIASPSSEDPAGNQPPAVRFMVCSMPQGQGVPDGHNFTSSQENQTTNELS